MPDPQAFLIVPLRPHFLNKSNLESGAKSVYFLFYDFIPNFSNLRLSSIFISSATTSTVSMFGMG